VLSVVVAHTALPTLVSCGTQAAAPPPSPHPSPPLFTPSPTASPTPSLADTGPVLVSQEPFWTDGDLIEGWHWLRDADHQDSAAWAIEDVPDMIDIVVLDMTVLATDRVNGGPRVDARFYLSWAALADDGTATFGPAKLVALSNESTDPVGYTCKGMVGVPLPAFGSRRTLIVRVRRDDPDGGRAPIDVHVAVNAQSLTPLYGE